MAASERPTDDALAGGSGADSRAAFWRGDAFAWMAEQFRLAGLAEVEIDAAGNVFGIIGAAGLEQAADGPVVILSAHLDTVFPADTPLEPVVKDDRIEAPGACDNASGIIGMLAIAHALSESKMRLGATLVFCGNVGEEGEGDLRGMRHLYQYSRYAGRVAAHLVLDGAGAETAVTQALGSRDIGSKSTDPVGIALPMPVRLTLFWCWL
jgi:tripeptide aminopeptidase